MQNYLHDEKFLKKLDLQRNKEVFARITALTMEELPVEWIEGKIQNSGSVSVDGNSAIRRTCSLSLLAQDVDINQYNWGLNHKFKLEVGLTNTVDPKYPDICWFKQGIYVITSFSCNVSNNNYSVSISGKDKGCMLNGEVGGQLPASIDFGKIESYNEFYEEVQLTEDIYETNKYYVGEDIYKSFKEAMNTLYFHMWQPDVNDNRYGNLGDDTHNFWVRKKTFHFEEYQSIINILFTPDDNNNQGYKYFVVENNEIDLDDDTKKQVFQTDWETVIRPCLKNLHVFVFTVLTYNNESASWFCDDRVSGKLVVRLYRLASEHIFQLATGIFDPDATYYMKSSQLSMDKVPIKTIIREAVHTYAREPYSNIIINDLDDYGMELMEYRGKDPIYLTHLLGAEVYGQMVRGSQECRIVPDTVTNTTVTYDESEFDNLSSATFGTLGDYDKFTTELDTHPGKKVIANVEPDDGATKTYKVFTVSKIEYGMTPGYRITPLVYAGELISSIGETLSSVLDKIKNMLTAFEYFYDLDGRFIFQKKQLFTMTSWNNIVDDKAGQKYVNPAMLSSPYYYTFEDSMIVTAFNNQPNLNNLRNDYSVWGKRKTATGIEIPIHMRLAFDKKPKCYARIVMDNTAEIIKLQQLYPSIFTANGIGPYLQEAEFYFVDGALPSYDTEHGATWQQNVFYHYDSASDSYIINNNVKIYDWRELIYRMALDYYKYGQMEDFGVRLSDTNRDLWDLCNDDPAAANPYLYFKTGYEQYYVDMEGFWRQLYDPEVVKNIHKTYEYYTDDNGKILTYIDSTDNNKIKPRIKTITFNSDYFIPNTENYVWINNTPPNNENLIDTAVEQQSPNDQDRSYPLTFVCNYLLADTNNKNKYWNTNVYNYPELLNFWIDFYDDGEMNQYSVAAVGQRPKVVNDNNVKAIYYRDTPTIIFTTAEQYKANFNVINTGYRYIFITEAMADQLFTISAQGKSAKDAIDDLLYTNSYCVESVSMTTFPVYYLEPNVYVYIKDKQSGIDGQYTITKFSVPLTYNGTMSITATKAVNRII